MLKTLKRKEVIDSIEGKKCPSHVPMTFGIWPPNYRDFRFFQAIACHVRFPGDLFVTYSASYIAQMARGQGVVLQDKGLVGLVGIDCKVGTLGQKIRMKPDHYHFCQSLNSLLSL